MKFFARLGILLYVTAFIFVPVTIGMFVLHKISFEDTVKVLEAVYAQPDMRMTAGFIAVFILFVNYLFFKAITGERQKGKTLAFDNPGGRVTVSVNALEDLVRRVAFKTPQVKDVRTVIRIARRKLLVRATLVLNAEVNIPEITSSLQEAVKKRIQDTIGMEEAVEVRIDIINMIPASTKVKKQKEKDALPEPEEIEPTVPFRGYRA